MRMRANYHASPIVGAATLVLSMLATAQNAGAATCEMLTDLIRDARTEYKLAMRDADLESRKENALQAKKLLNETATAAVDCRCLKVHRELVTAASRAGQAHEAPGPGDFANSLQQSILSFNAAMNELRLCARYGG